MSIQPAYGRRRVAARSDSGAPLAEALNPRSLANESKLSAAAVLKQRPCALCVGSIRATLVRDGK